MKQTDWIREFGPLTKERLLTVSQETLTWIGQYSHKDGDAEYWDILPGTDVPEAALLLKSTSLYGGAAGIALLYLRAYVTTGHKEYLEHAKAGIRYCIREYKGTDDYRSDSPFLAGAFIGFMNGPAGGGYAAHELYKITSDETYKAFALQTADDAIASAKDENGTLTWYGDYGILGEGSFALYFLELYKAYGIESYLDAAKKTAAYLLSQEEPAPQGGSRWNVMDTETFVTIRKPGGYFPGFEYGAAGCGYILAALYEVTEEKKYLTSARNAATYILTQATYTKDGRAALVRYNDTYLTDLYYLGVCQGPIGTSRLFYKLYEITGEEPYKDFVLQLTEGLLASGAPKVHSPGYWRTNCYCCGAAGMLEHFINIHKWTGEPKYLDAAYDAARTLIGDSTEQDGTRMWYTAWNRHEPETSEAYTGLYHGSAGCAASLLALAQYAEDGSGLPGYLEDPYKDLFK